MKKRALVLGNVPKVLYVTDFLKDKGYRVSIINRVRNDAELIAQITTVPVICGDGTLPEILLESGMQNADIAVIMLNAEDDNFVASILCKRLLNIKRVITILEDANKLSAFYQAGIDSIVCEAASITSILNQQEFLDGMGTLVPISGGRVNVVEVPINEAAPIVGKKLWEIELPREVIVGCVLRGEHSIVPRGDTRILSGDTLILIASDKQEVTAIKKLTGYV